MNKGLKTQKIFSLFCFLLAAGLLMFVCIPILRTFSHTIPIVIGPYKKAVLIFSAILLLLGADLHRNHFKKETALAWLFFLLGSSFFIIRMIITFTAPGKAEQILPQRFLFLPMVLIISGVFLRGKTVWNAFRIPEIPEKWTAVLLILLLFITLSPILRIGFCWDDSFFSARIPAMRIFGQSILQRTWDEIGIYAKMGRINPFATFQFLAFYVLTSPFVFKILIIALTLFGCWLFYRFLLRWTHHLQLSALSLILIPLCIQLRLYHDPMTGYYGLMQLMFIELMASLIFLLRYLETGKRSMVLCSLAFFLIGLTSYEMFYPLLILVLFIIWTQKRSVIETLRCSLPYILIEFLLFSASMILRSSAASTTASYSGTTFSLDFFTVFSTWLKQSFAAFPLSYQLSNEDAVLTNRVISPDELFSFSFTSFLQNIELQDILCLSIAGLILWQTAKSESPKWNLWKTIGAGILLVALPGMTIAVSQKYQEQIVWGTAYIPVYFEYFGAALILGALFLSAISNKQKHQTVRALSAGLFCVVFLVTMQNNRRSAEYLNESFLYPRQAGEAALQAGILGSFDNSQTTIVSDNEFYLWEHGWGREPFQESFYSLNHRSEVHALGIPEFATHSGCELTKEQTCPEKIYPKETQVIAYGGTRNFGFAKAGNLVETSIDLEKSILTEPIVSEVRVFICGEKNTTDQIVYTTRDGVIHTVPLYETWRLSETEQGTLYKINEQNTILFDTIRWINSL